MQMSTFRPDENIQLHEEGAVERISKGFQSHVDGIPEWAKNSSDKYRRLGLDKEDSHIILLTRNRRKDKSQPTAIGCLDFGGMSVNDIKTNFRNWADPDASGSGEHSGVTGGHGNGGKSYMVQMFEGRAYLHTLLDGQASQYGYPEAEGPERLTSGFFDTEDGRRGEGYTVMDPDAELAKALDMFGLRIKDLPEQAQRVWNRRKGFTLVVGLKAKEVKSRPPKKQWLKKLRWHPQMLQVLKMNRVYWYHGGQLLEEANPVQTVSIPPHPVSTQPRKITVPETLQDPDTGQEVETGAEEGESFLRLKTSEKRMTSSRRKPRHKIHGRTTDGAYTGYWEVDAVSTATYAKHIYGTLQLDRLKKVEDNARREHINSSLTSALQHWMGEKIDELSNEFSEYERSDDVQKHRDKLSQMNNALNNAANEILDEFEGVGPIDKSGTGGPGLPEGKPEDIELSLTYDVAGQGVKIRPSKQFFDGDGKQIKSVPHSLNSSDPEVASVEGNEVITHASGRVELWVSCAADDAESNRVTLEVLDIEQIVLEPQEVELESGSGRFIEPIIADEDGRVEKGVYLRWDQGDETIADVGRTGRVTGRQPGTTTIIAYDDNTESADAATLKVTPSEEDGEDDGRPKILLSEVDDDPFGDGPPTFSPEEPPVYQRPTDVSNNIWWINMASPLANWHLQEAGDDVRESAEFRSYLIERYIEALSQIVLSSQTEGEEMGYDTFLRKSAEQATRMQRWVSETLTDFLKNGSLPTHE